MFEDLEIDRYQDLPLELHDIKLSLLVIDFLLKEFIDFLVFFIQFSDKIESGYHLVTLIEGRIRGVGPGGTLA